MGPDGGAKRRSQPDVPVLGIGHHLDGGAEAGLLPHRCQRRGMAQMMRRVLLDGQRSEEHTSELQSLMRTSYAVFCLKKKNTNDNRKYNAFYKTKAAQIHTVSRLSIDTSIT